MDATFETIGLEVPSEKAINFLAERAENQGEPTQLLRRGAVLHGRCWKLGEGLEQVELTEEAAILAEGYVSRGIFHRKFIADALHVAVASCHKIDYLVTWNFGHLANVRRQARIRLFNTAAGFFVPMIVTPEFLVSEATEISDLKTQK